MKSFKEATFCSLLVVLLISTTSVLAVTPQNYIGRLGSARVGVEQLLRRVGVSTPEEERALVRSIERDVPANETIELPGGSVETDNKWLHAKLKELSDQTDGSKRTAILSEVSERLLAITVAVEIRQKASAKARSKDEDKQKLAEILGREEYRKPEPKAESRMEKWWREFLEWLARTFPPAPESERSPSSGIGSLQFILQIVILTAVIALIAFLIYRFAPFVRRGFGWAKGKDDADRVILGERISRDESASDIFSEAESLARAGNLRGAIRKGYIAALCDMADRKVLRLARHKTNRDYLRDVRNSNEIFEHLRALTLSFENNWYGFRAADVSDWEEFRANYLRMLSNAGRASK